MSDESERGPETDHVRMRKVRLTLQYDGTGYSGWQVQPGRRTIQGVIEAGLERITGERPSLVAAGRTDAGVHALEQVASFLTSSLHPPEVFKRALNGVLPGEIRVLSAEYAAVDFHPRYDARSKRYFYLIDSSEVASPFLQRYSYHLGRGLDTEEMARAASSLAGRHDFASFMASGSSVKSTVREVYGISVEQAEEVGFLGAVIPGRFVKITIEANAFLRHMARNIVGTLIEVGLGRMGAEDVKAVVEARDRRSAGATAPARGLFLERVLY